ncbi:MAG: hypothetical protein WBH50_03130, partial [Fuerstiella sp.]
ADLDVSCFTENVYGAIRPLASSSNSPGIKSKRKRACTWLRQRFANGIPEMSRSAEKKCTILPD